MKKHLLSIDSYDGKHQRDVEPTFLTEDEIIIQIREHMKRGVALQITIDGEHVIGETLNKAQQHLENKINPTAVKGILN